MMNLSKFDLIVLNSILPWFFKSNLYLLPYKNIYIHSIINVHADIYNYNEKNTHVKTCMEKGVGDQM